MTRRLGMLLALTVLAGTPCARRAEATLITKNLVVAPSDVQITNEGGGRRAVYRNLFDFDLFDGDTIDVTVTLAQPMTIADLGTGTDNLESLFFGTLNNFGQAATRTYYFEFTGLTGSVLANPITTGQIFNGDLTAGAFTFTGMRYVASVSDPLFPGSPITSGFGFGFDFTADHVDMAGARVCGDGAENTQLEQCDEGEANGSASSCCTADCLVQPAGRTCRGAATSCDLPEVCDGAGGSCPADVHGPDGAACDDGVLCNGVDRCLAGACADHVNRPVGTPCESAGVPGGCDGDGVCVVPECGNGDLEPGEECDGGECCTSACRLKGPTEPCGTETRVCHEQPLCNGREPVCPAVDRLAPEGSTCSDANECTVEDTCQQGDCVAGPTVCAASALVRGNGKKKVTVKLVCESDLRAECEAAVLPDAAGALGADTSVEPLMQARVRKTRRVRGGALPFRTKLKLRLTERGKALLAAGDSPARVVVTVRRAGREFRPPVTLIRLLQIRRR